jgi:chromate transporter
MQDAELEIAPRRSSGRELCDLAAVFLRLGTTAFGGPAAHVAMMENEFVRRRRWLTHQRLLDMLGAVNLIPGPNSTEMAIYVGYLRAGWMGLVLAGCCFIIPAMAIVSAIAWAYVRFGSLPQFAGPLYGVKPVVIAIILQAFWGLAPKATKTKRLAAIGLLALAGGLCGVDPLSLMLAAGGLYAVSRLADKERAPSWRPVALLAVVVGSLLAAMHLAPRLTSTSNVPFGLGALFLYFLKVGSVLYGSGYVLLAFLEGDLVQRWHWLTSQQLLDATAVGQVTPGPLFTTATFIGYLKGAEVHAAIAGALLATLAIFLPSFVFIVLGSRLFPRLRNSATAGAFLDGVNVAALALMAAVSWQLGRAAIVDIPTIALALAAGVLLFRFRLSSTWLVLGGALAGFLLKAV